MKTSEIVSFENRVRNTLSNSAVDAGTKELLAALMHEVSVLAQSLAKQ